VRSEAPDGSAVVVSAAAPGLSPELPQDCTPLPLASGELLVSREHAVFCRVPPEETEAVRAVLAGQRSVAGLSRELREDLDRHGFFGPPREGKSDPLTVQLQLTNDCNLACRYCCTNSGEPREQEVCYERMLEVVRQIPEATGDETRVALLGGEPLLVPWALDLAEEIVARGLALTIFTNGLPLADEGSDELVRRTAALTNRGVQVRISLAGPSASSCDELSGTDRFAAALRGLHRLAEFGGRAIVDLMITPQNAAAIARELPLLRRSLPAGMPLALGVLYRGGREAGEHLFSSRIELEAALDRITFEAGETIPGQQRGPLADRREGCSCALGRHVDVRSDGAIFNCFKMEEKVGDLEGPGFATAAREVQEHPHPSTALPTCADCPLVTLCGGGCRAENLLYTGDPDEPPCGEWRVRVLSELLAEDRVKAVEWSVDYLQGEARARGIELPADLAPRGISRHLLDV